MTDLYARAAQLAPEKRALLQKLLKQKAATRLDAQTLRRRTDTGPAPLSFAQERLWLLHRIDPGSTA